MKRTLKRLLCLFLATLMCVTILPQNAYAWKYMSHANSANILRMEMLSYGNADENLEIYTLKDGQKDQTFSYSIPDEFYDAIRHYPEAFRAGSLGPDFYPDILIGQMYIHPFDEEAYVGSGDWLSLLVDSVNRLPKWSPERDEALAFTLGYMLHYCGDMFGHDFVNTFSGGTFPSFLDVDIQDSENPELNNILSHMSIESFMDELVNGNFWGNEGQLAIEAPNRFVSDSMVVNGNISAGIADLYKNFETEESEDDMLGGAPVHIDTILSFRAGVWEVAEKFRDDIGLAGISSYADRWAQDIDRAIYGLVESFDMIAHRLVTGEKNPAIKEETLHDWIFEGYPLKEILKDRLDLDKINTEDGTVSIILEELSLWLEVYGWKALGIPDVFVDGLPEWMDYITLIFTWPMDIVMAGVKTALSYIFAEIIVAAVGSEVNLLLNQLEAFKARLEDPKVQLDHIDNPYDPTGNRENFNELKEYFRPYYNEQRLLIGQNAYSLLNDTDGTHVLDRLVDSDFEAFYNTMTMFKLILMGPENFSAFLRANGITSQNAYAANTGELDATVLKLDVKTIDMPYSGTDDNVWAIVRKVKSDGTLGETIATRLLDNSYVNDLECGDTNTFYIELPYPVKLDEFDIVIKQEDTGTAGGDWACESIKVTPMHAGVELTDPIGVGGNLHMKDGVSWNVDFQTALSYHLAGGIFLWNGKMPVTHVIVTIKTGNGDYLSGTDQDVSITAWDPINAAGTMAKVELDKYLYNDFEDGDHDSYIVPVGEFDKTTGKNNYPTLGGMNLWIRQDSDYDWYIKNVTVTPYYGTLQLTEPMDFGSGWIKESSDKIDVSPWIKINKGTISYYYNPPLYLTYETSLDDGLLEDMRSLDAGVQWVYLPTLWNTVSGRRLFFKLFKGFEPEIELEYEDVITNKDTLDLKILFSGKWNGVSESRRNALAEYAKNYLGQDTYSEMLPVTGQVTVTIRDSATGQAYSPQTVNVDGEAEIQMSNLDPGTYNIEVSYTATGVPSYADTEVIYENALLVTEDMSGILVKAAPNHHGYGEVTGSGMYERPTGDRKKTITLTAIPNPGYEFQEWLYNGESINATNSSHQIILRASLPEVVEYTAVFAPIKYTINIGEPDNEYVSVEGSGIYEHGETVTLKANAARTQVFLGWYENDVLVSSKDSYSFTATENRNFTAKFGTGKQVRLHDPDDCGYEIYPDNFTVEEWNGYKVFGADLFDLGRTKVDAVGRSFYVRSGDLFTFDLGIKDGYEKGDDFAVKAVYSETKIETLNADKNGKYIISDIKQHVIIMVEGVRRIEYTPAPVIIAEETDDGITFTAEGEGEITLFVNGRAVDNGFKLSRDELNQNSGIFSASATAKALNKRISDRATLDGNSSGIDVMIPIIIEDSENGTVAVDEKYGAPGTEVKLTATPDAGYVLDKLLITYNNGTETEEVEYTANKVVESVNEEGGIDTEVVVEEGVYYFSRPDNVVTVKAVFKPEGGVTVSGTVTSFDSAPADTTNDTVTVKLFRAGSATAAYEAVVQGNSAAYSIEGVAAGTYTLRVMKADHVTGEYTVVVGNSNATCNATIYLLGDANHDGKADSSDAVAILRNLAGYEVSNFYKDTADFNCDGKADSSDAVAILRKLAGY